MNSDKLSDHLKKPSIYEKGTANLWTDPYVSQKFLEQQLNTSSDIASRDEKKSKVILDWILSLVTKPKMDVLDLGCGPGLYAEQLTQKGHSVVGVDISECAISFAKQSASNKNLTIKYLCDNYLNLKYENAFDLVILFFLEFSLLNPIERQQLLNMVGRALKTHGILAFDVMNSSYANPKNLDEVMPESYEEKQRGFWSPTPYVASTKSYHYPKDKVILNQYVLSTDREYTKIFRVWNRYYDEGELVKILNSSGFTPIDYNSKLLVQKDSWNGNSISFLAVSKAE